MISPDRVVVGNYDCRLVTLSVLISILGTCAARDRSERARDSLGCVWLVRLVWGPIANEISASFLQYSEIPAFNLLL